MLTFSCKQSTIQDQAHMTVAERVAALNSIFKSELSTPTILRMRYRQERIHIKKLIITKQDPNRKDLIAGDHR